MADRIGALAARACGTLREQQDLPSVTRRWIILASARVKNRAAQVTGAMTFNENFFVQVLEGPTAGLIPIFRRICRDTRHCDLKILAQTQPSRRLSECVAG